MGYMLEIGLLLVTSPAAAFLKTGIMTACFHTSGTEATDNSWLKARASGVARQCFKRLRVVASCQVRMTDCS